MPMPESRLESGAFCSGLIWIAEFAETELPRRPGNCAVVEVERSGSLRDMRVAGCDAKLVLRPLVAETYEFKPASV